MNLDTTLEIRFPLKSLSYSGEWEIQEGFYGLMQGMVLISLFLFKGKYERGRQLFNSNEAREA